LAINILIPVKYLGLKVADLFAKVEKEPQKIMSVKEYRLLAEQIREYEKTMPVMEREG